MATAVTIRNGGDGLGRVETTIYVSVSGTLPLNGDKTGNLETRLRGIWDVLAADGQLRFLHMVYEDASGWDTLLKVRVTLISHAAAHIHSAATYHVFQLACYFPCIRRYRHSSRRNRLGRDCHGANLGHSSIHEVDHRYDCLVNTGSMEIYDNGLNRNIVIMGGGDLGLLGELHTYELQCV